ncbi:hypothetical protein Cni_G19597 [Canna indica]|uniref:Uncharacterized protein n=1 Tax=Canna indica TaxID=4628 RepID=A0AAQ3KPS5_9LILI|nr:hypothetical protein Cni_G19597 [Canna indica]
MIPPRRMPGVRHRGLRTKLNFPDTPPPLVPSTARPLTYRQIQATATRHMASDPSPPGDSADQLPSRELPQRKRRLAKTSTFTPQPPSEICRIRS